MAPRSQIILVASLLLAATASAQVPEACQAVIDLTQQCSTSSTPDEITSCLCEDSNLESNLRECAGGNPTPEIEQALANLRQLCAGTLPTPTGTDEDEPTGTPTGTDEDEPTETPSPTGDEDETTTTPAPSGGSGDGADSCSSLVVGLSSCATGTTPLTAAPVASCLCEAPTFDDDVAGCYTYLRSIDEDRASTIGNLSGFCSRFGGGGSSPTRTGGQSSAPTSESEAEETSSGGITSAPTSTGSVTGPAGAGQTSSRSAGSVIKTTFASSAIAALFIGVAMLL